MSEIICGDALSSLRALPDGIVQTCVTSPPYFGLRDYNVEGQIGLEDNPDAYISRLVEVFREVRRVLRDDGTLWVNIGDSYAGSWGNYAPGGIKGVQRSRSKEGERWERKAYQDTTFLPPTARVKGLKPKDLIGIPWMLAFALRADGWYLRSDIIWSKPNCMPESVTDRPTKAHEYIFLLSKNERYYYDADAIAEPMIWTGGAGNRNYRTWAIDGRINAGQNNEPNPAGRNKRSVWTVSTSPFSEAHFATFPPKLIEPCILAGTSPQACEHCGAAWERVTESYASGQGKPSTNLRQIDGHSHDRVSRGEITRAGESHVVTTGWQPTCTCNNTGSGSCAVLDPFCGAGTVPLVALKYQRAYIGIELNPEYVKLINKRIHTTQPVLWEVGA